MPVVSVFTPNVTKDLSTAVPLPLYAQYINYRETAFFGINHSGDAQYNCRAIWMKSERDLVARYLAQAQQDIELELGFHLTPKYIEAENHPYRNPMLLKKTKLLGFGVRAETLIQANAALNYAADPATVTVATTATDPNEIVVYHPGTSAVIYPSSITIAGGNAVISIPWARLVSAASQDNERVGLTYADVPPSLTSPYEDVVDVYRVHLDTSDLGVAVWPQGKSCCPGCTEETEAICVALLDAYIGSCSAVRSNGSCCWSSRYAPSVARINYLSGYGYGECPNVLVDAVIRLAHSRMPVLPCADCDAVRFFWERDRRIPESTTKEQVNCKWGNNAGAWFAWETIGFYRFTSGGGSF